jgi:predicted O-methyltransferase YrrM
MNDAAFVGSIPQHYDQGLGPVIFADYAADIARRAAAYNPKRVLETAAGTGIVTRQLRDALPSGTRLTATDLHTPMLEVARANFRFRAVSGLPSSIAPCRRGARKPT